MKATMPNGTIIEGSISEIAQFIGMQNTAGTRPIDTLQTIPPTPSKKSHNYRGRKPSNNTIIHKNYQRIEDGVKQGFSISSAMRQANVIPGGFQTKKFLKLLKHNNIGLYNNYKARKPIRKTRETKHRKYTTNSESILKRATRMKFIHSKINYYNKQGFNLPYEEAFKRASEEYNNNKRTIQIKPFPAEKLSTLSPMPLLLSPPETNNLLFDILGNVIANHGKMTYFNEGKMLGCDTIEQWNMLLAHINVQSNNIVNYFNVPNKFVIKFEDNRKTLSYRN